MEPKTKIQKQVAELSEKLPALSEQLKVWGIEHSLDSFAVRQRSTLFCLECGHSWKDSAVLVSAIAGATCPCCRKDLKMATAYNRSFKDSAYYAVITTIKGFQVVRTFFLQKQMRKQCLPNIIFEEVLQHWISESGMLTIMSKNVFGFSRYFDQWVFHSGLEVRPSSAYGLIRYNIEPYKIYPKMKVLPVIRRNGFRNSFHGNAPHKLFSMILSNSYAETLLKAKQYSLLSYCVSHPASFAQDNLWPAIKICIRNSYLVKDAQIWVDYLKLLEYFNRDIRNAKYTCPEKLSREHDRLVAKKRAIQRKEDLEKQKVKLAEDEKEYINQKGQYIGIAFTDGLIKVEVLRTVKEHILEGDILGHCVYTGGYYSKPDSLIMSARKGEEKLETVELSLSKMEVVQCRGRKNKNSRYHDRILKLVNSNIPAISKKAKQKLTA